MNDEGQGGKTTIMLASDMGHTDLVREFVKHDKIDVNCTSDIGKTAFIMASAKGHLSVVRELLKHDMGALEFDEYICDAYHVALSLQKSI